jgi:hypothetical protein
MTDPAVGAAFTAGDDSDGTSTAAATSVYFDASSSLALSGEELGAMSIANGPSGDGVGAPPPQPPLPPALPRWHTCYELRTDGDFDGAARVIAEATTEGEPVGSSAPWLWVRSRLESDLADEMGDVAAAKRALPLADMAVGADGKLPEAHLAVAIAAGRVQEVPGTGIRTRVEMARRIREHLDICLRLCAERYGDPPEGDEFHTTYTALMVLGKWHYGLASLPGVHKFVVRAVFGKMPHYSYEEAARAHRKQLEMLPHNPLPRMELGRVLIDMGDKDGAADQLNEFLCQAPHDRYCGPRLRLQEEAAGMLKATGRAAMGAAQVTKRVTHGAASTVWHHGGSKK